MKYGGAGGGKTWSGRGELVRLAADMLLSGRPCTLLLHDAPWPEHSYRNWTKQVMRERCRELDEEAIEMLACGLTVIITK